MKSRLTRGFEFPDFSFPSSVWERNCVRDSVSFYCDALARE